MANQLKTLFLLGTLSTVLIAIGGAMGPGYLYGHGNLVRRQVLEHLLPVRVVHRAQRLVPLDESPPGLRGPFGGDGARQFVLQVGVAADPAVGEGVRAAQQIRGLHLGQRERQVPPVRVGHEGLGERVAQIREHGVPVGAQPLTQVLGEGALRRPEADTAVLLPQLDSGGCQFGHQLGGAHRSPSSQV